MLNKTSCLVPTYNEGERIFTVLDSLLKKDILAEIIVIDDASEIDITKDIKKRYPKAYLIGILPPSLKEQENRMKKRGDMCEEEINERLSKSREERKILFKYYKCRLINKDIEKTVERIKKLIES